MYSNKHADEVKVFWDGKDKDGNQLGFNDYGFKEAIRRAYKDYMPRTMQRNNIDIGGKNITEVMLDYVCDETKFQNDNKSFLNKIEDWFNNKTNIEQKAYDKWHKECCDKILQCFEKYYDNGVTYGKAQKIVNMTMKGIYCLDGAENYEDWFKHCHMALDSIILEWFKRDVVSFYNKKNKSDKINTNMLDKWSNFDFSKYMRKNNKGEDKDYYGYEFYVEKIREYFLNRNNEILHTFSISDLTPFQAEFYIWRDMQIHTLTEVLFSQEFGKEERIDKVNAELVNNDTGEVDTFDNAKKAFKNFSLEKKLAIVEDAITLIAEGINN